MARALPAISSHPLELDFRNVQAWQPGRHVVQPRPPPTCPRMPGSDQPSRPATIAATVRARSMSTRGRRYLRDSFRRTTTRTTVPRPIARERRFTGPPPCERQPEAIEDVLMAGAAVFQAEQVAHLGQADQETGPGHETEHHRFGDVPRQVAQLEHGDQDLDDADHHGQQEGRFDGQPLVGSEKGQGTEDHQRDGVGRTVDQVRRGAEDRGDGRHHDGRVQPEARVDAGDQRIGHRLGHGNGGHRQAGNEVSASVTPSVDPGHYGAFVRQSRM